MVTELVTMLTLNRIARDLEWSWGFSWITWTVVTVRTKFVMIVINHCILCTLKFAPCWIKDHAWLNHGLPPFLARSYILVSVNFNRIQVEFFVSFFQGDYILLFTGWTGWTLKRGTSINWCFFIEPGLKCGHLLPVKIELPPTYPEYIHKVGRSFYEG
jgi:hypothetical protein